MPSCGKGISTENGVLTCDGKIGHKDQHHAKHGGGQIPTTDFAKTKEGDLILRKSEALEVWWPQEGDNSPVVLKKG